VVRPGKQGQPRGSKLDAYEGSILAMVEAAPDIALHEIAERLAREHGVRVVPSTVWLFFEKRHMRRFNGVPKAQFGLYLKDCEWRFNNSDPAVQLSQLRQWVKRHIRELSGSAPCVFLFRAFHLDRYPCMAEVPRR